MRTRGVRRVKRLSYTKYLNNSTLQYISGYYSTSSKTVEHLGGGFSFLFWQLLVQIYKVAGKCFYNFMYFTGWAALVKVNYSPLCDFIENRGKEGKKTEEGKGRENNRGGLHTNKIVEQVALAAFVGLLAGIY